ncbi:MAG TPA: hypothetical protein VGQ71_13690 [Terriglobales bacterium]|nr:hypothetical protein [Terriglobales bacterium]
MIRLLRGVIFLMAVISLLSISGWSQQTQQAQAPVFTYVAEWEVPRARWAEFTDNFEKNTRPQLERFTRDGIVVSWGGYSTYVHQKGENTHGVWWASPSLAGIERVRAQLIQAAPSPAMAEATMHRDYLLRSVRRRSRAAGPQSGVLSVSSFTVQPGKEEAWMQLGEKNYLPVIDELVANGTISEFSIDVEQVHNNPPGLHFIAYVAPNMEAVDKVVAALRAAEQKWPPEQRRTVMQGMMETTVPGAHRDYMATVSSYQTK